MTENNSIRFSIIIPAYNEEAYLPRLLETIEKARLNYLHGAEKIEVIVADNCSTDSTAEIASQNGCMVVKVEKRAIAAARNGGAHSARGEVLAFVDADSKIHIETFNAIDSCLRTGNVVAGATGVRMERMSPGIAAAYMMIVPLLVCLGMDAGVIFCRKEDFQKVGGYNEEMLAAEDVRFLWDLKKLGKASGRKLARVTSARTITSTRKFDELGDWHYVGLILRTLLAVTFSRQKVDKIIKDYWYNVRC